LCDPLSFVISTMKFLKFEVEFVNHIDRAKFEQMSLSPHYCLCLVRVSLDHDILLLLRIVCMILGWSLLQAREIETCRLRILIERLDVH
jgi:hypothetical protein